MQEVARRTTQTSLARRVEVGADLLDLALASAALLVLGLALAVLLLLLGRVDDVLLVRLLALVAVRAVARVAHLEAGHHLAVDLQTGARLFVLAFAGALLTSRERQAGIRASCEELVGLVLLPLVPTVLEEPPSNVYQEVEATVRMPVHLAVHVSHCRGQARELLEPIHPRAVALRLRRLRVEREHESGPRVHDGLQVLVLAAE